MSTNSTSSQTSSTDAFAFSLAQDVWDKYVQYRPPYPDSQWEVWLDYHKGPLEVVHEIGTGCGVGMASFLKVAKDRRSQPIRRAILSDPTESNIITTRNILTKDRFPEAEFDFHQQPAEGCFLEPNSIDMVFACECLHFTEINECLSRMHESLRPGGTMAATFYDSSGAVILDSPRAEKAYRAAFADLVAGVKEGRHQRRIDVANMYKSRLNLGLNWVSLDSEKWVDISRLFINIPDGQKEWPLIEGFKGVLPNESNVKEETEKLEWIQDREGWGIKAATADWVKGLLGTMEVELGESFWRGPIWKEFVDAVSDKGGAVWIVLPANYLLARKRWTDR